MASCTLSHPAFISTLAPQRRDHLKFDSCSATNLLPTPISQVPPISHVITSNMSCFDGHRSQCHLPPSPSPLPPHTFRRQLFLLHKAILSTVDRLVAAVDTLTPLAPDVFLDDLQRRVAHLRETLVAHCTVEDATMFPLLRSALLSAESQHSSVLPSQSTPPPGSTTPPTLARPEQLSPTSPSTPAPSTNVEGAPSPAKRPRISSPIAVHLHALQSDHNHTNLLQACNQLQILLAHLRATPLARDELPRPGIPQMEFLPPSPWKAPPQPSTNTILSSSSPESRIENISRARNAAAHLRSVIQDHFNAEEIQIPSAYVKLLTTAQQTSLLVKVARSIVSDRRLANTLRLVSDHDLFDLLNTITSNAKEEFKPIVVGIFDVLPQQRWTLLCQQIPSLNRVVVPNQDPLVGILFMHKAMIRELCHIVSYCESLDPCHFKQMRTLCNKVDFIHRVHNVHVKGEEAILFKNLCSRAQLLSLPFSIEGFNDDHRNEEAMFVRFAKTVEELKVKATRAGGDERSTRLLKQQLNVSVQNMSTLLTAHMDEEESKLLPLVRKHFSLEEQKDMVRKLRDIVPTDLIRELVPWLFRSLQVSERESMLRHLLRSSPPEEIRRVVGILAESVRKGDTDRAEWGEICLRVPAVEEVYQAISEKEEENVGPVSEILRVHKAFRIELNVMLRRCREIASDGTFPNPKALVSLAQGVAFLRRMVLDHSQAEDDIILPRLESRKPGISETYHDDHCDERKLFQDLAECLQDLQCVAEEAECLKLVVRLHGLAETLHDEMVSHLNKEEEHMWPLLTKNFSLEEQSEIVALIFGQMPAERLRELLPWMLRIFSVSEGNTMMNHILEVTRSTMFETWLKTWLPLENGSSIFALSDSLSSSHDRDTSVQNNGNTINVLVGIQSELRAVESAESLRNKGSSETTGDGSSAALVILNGRKTMERTIRAIARDDSLSAEERARMMQQVMLAPYSEARAQAMSRSCDGTGVVGDRTPTFRVCSDGARRLGCRHYLRACKLRAECCGKLYTCRLCHDDAEETHIMDRYATKEMLCMRCDTLQSVSAKCVNVHCGMLFASYFCEVCKFFDGSPGRHIYHCPSCNVCRAGKGLGVDFFHCMRCNQCMSIRFRTNGHRCIERAMESDCPICSQYLFTSTQPVKYLKCGHLMHRACHEKYVQRCGRCPVCSKSLEEMTPVYQRIDRLVAANGRLAMPAEYRTARCDIYCLDCHTRSNTSYHFVYNKCPVCNSYNTRVESVDPNGETSPTRESDVEPNDRRQYGGPSRTEGEEAM